MIFEMHCHTKEGSLDSFVTLKQTIKILKSKGFDGMVVTDHNSYKGYEKAQKYNLVNDFIVIRGVEYDTSDAGHVLVILPDNKELNILTKKGLPVREVISIVHAIGGVIGLAHPFGHGRFGIWWYLKYKQLEEIFGLFDFIEVFNASATTLANSLAYKVSEKYGLTGTGGSDSHRYTTVGLVKTTLNYNIKNGTDLIQAMLSKNVVSVEGAYANAMKRKLVRGIFKLSTSIYCRINSLIYRCKLNKLMRECEKLKVSLMLEYTENIMLNRSTENINR